MYLVISKVLTFITGYFKRSIEEEPPYKLNNLLRSSLELSRKSENF